jgi:hypothetical protein
MPHAKCKLCLRITDLQNSHLMPASLYKKSRIPSTSNPNPTLVTEKGSKQISRQIRNFVLCHDCEQLFSKNGESYVMTQVFDGKSRKFPLLDTLQATAPTWGGPELVGYELGATPDLDREKLGYFALSVFWRASVHIWRERGEEPVTLELGKIYNEAFRKYLLGQTGFPADVVLLVIPCTHALSQDTFYVPSLGSKNVERTYSFMAKGLNFLMIVGKQLRAPAIRELCAVTGTRRLILARSCESKVQGAHDRLMRLHQTARGSENDFHAASVAGRRPA